MAGEVLPRARPAKVAMTRAAVQTCMTMNVPPLHRPGAPRYAAVLFDFGGTLDADGAPSVEQFLRAYRAAGGRRGSDEFEVIFGESDRRLATDPATSTLGFREAIAAQSHSIAELARGTEALDAARIGDRVERGAVAVAERNVEVLRTLRTAGCRIGVVSNFTGNLERCLTELKLAPLIDVVLDSAVVGVRKPDSKIFIMALQQLGAEPARALMVGDNPFVDVRPAAALGMATCWIAASARAVPEGCAPTFRIERLPQLLEHLELPPQRAESAPVTACTG